MSYKRYNYKSVYMDSSHYRITVSPEGYKQIWELVQRVKVCETCNEYYSVENPNIAGNMCLCCFSGLHTGLSFVGPLHPEGTEQQENPAYLFLSKENGHTYTSKAGPGVQAEAHEDRALTLNYWQFPRPTQGQWNGKTVELGEYWHIYGDVRTDDLILIEKSEGRFLFVVQRNGEALQITRRRSKHRFLLNAIRADLEATRQPNGNYLFDGEEHYRIMDVDVYKRFVREINEERKAALAEQEERGEEEPGLTD